MKTLIHSLEADTTLVDFSLAFASALKSGLIGLGIRGKIGPPMIPGTPGMQLLLKRAANLPTHL